MNSLNPYTLSFRDASLETTYRHQYADWLRFQSRVAIVVGLGLYMLYGLVDLAEHHARLELIWELRTAAMSIAVLCLVYTFTRAFERHNQVAMSMAGLAAFGGIVAIQQTLSFDAASHYFPGLVLALFWTYLFLGVRFVTALIVGIGATLAYNVSLLLGFDPGYAVYVDQNFHLFAANVIGGFSSYILERQRRDLFEQQREIDRERRLHETLARQDNLTGLSNRRHLEGALEDLIRETGRRNIVCAGLFIDIDDFKPINDRHGHEVGDEVLQVLGKRLAHIVREQDFVARLGGDEFFVVIKELRARRTVEAIARKLLASLAEPMTIKPEGKTPIECRVSASLGIAFFPFRGATPAEILRRADSAMYRVKSQSRHDFHIYDAEPDTA